MRFMLNGDTRIWENQTPDEVGMEEGDIIQVFGKQDGGFSYYVQNLL